MPSYVQNNLKSQGTTNTATPSCQFNSNTSSGNLIVAIYEGGANRAVTSVTDSQSNSYVKAIAQGGTATPAEIWYALNIVGGTTPTVTVTIASACTFNVVEIYEFSGILSSAAADGAGSSAGGSSVSPASGNFTTANANDLIISGMQCANTSTAGTSGWNVESTSHQSEYLIVSATGTYNATYTQNLTGTWSVCLFAFKGSATNPSVAANPLIRGP
jgi:hypothetical protein